MTIKEWLATMKNRHQKIIRLLGQLLTIIIVALISYTTMIYSNDRASEELTGIALQGFGIIIGTVIAVFAIISPNNATLYKLLEEIKTSALFTGDMKEQITIMAKDITDNTIKIRQLVRRLLIFFIISFILPLFRYVNLPIVHWPITLKYFTKYIFISSSTLFSLLYSFVIIFEVIRMLFDMTDATDILAGRRVHKK